MPGHYFLKNLDYYLFFLVMFTHICVIFWNFWEMYSLYGLLWYFQPLRLIDGKDIELICIQLKIGSCF